MAVQRCPECGGRLHTNYCDVCMKKVLFAGARPQKYCDPWDYSSAHRQETGHKCITFDVPKQTFTKTVPNFPKRNANKKSDPKVTTVVAIMLGLLSLISAVFGIFEDIRVDNPTPEYNVEAFAPEEDLSVIQPTGIYSNGEIEILADSLGLYYEEPSLSFLIANYSEQDIDVVVEHVAVNGYMLEVGMSVYVDEGESCQAFLVLNREELEKYNIHQIQWIDLSLWIYDGDSYHEIDYIDLVTIETDLADT